MSLAEIQAQFGCHRLEIGKVVSSRTGRQVGGGAHFHNQFRQHRKHELGEIFDACPDMISRIYSHECVELKLFRAAATDGRGATRRLSNERARGREAGLTAAGKLPVHAHAECVETERAVCDVRICAPRTDGAYCSRAIWAGVAL
ncbi:MAG: hypothetical protein ACXU8R_19785 [Xanthobacteraceae bacterium]